MSEAVLLSIAIPTFGYPKAIIKNINNILSINRNDVELVVVDNDPSGMQIGDFINRIEDDRFHYYRNSTNIGRSANIAKAIENATAKFVLIASSDDMIRLESIEDIISMIKKYPNCGIIMGRVVSDRGEISGYCGGFKVYKKGYDALMVTPRMGTLYPFVVNKSYLDFDKLYSQEETYMQTRIAYSAAGRGDFIGIESVLADVVDQMSYLEDESRYELMNTEEWEEIKKTLSIGSCYYSPEARTEQLIKDIETIDAFNLRLSHKLKIIDKLVSNHLSMSLLYIPAAHDPYQIKCGGSVGFLKSEDVLDYFWKKMHKYFEQKEMNDEYYYTGKLRDKICNEKIIIKNVRQIRDTLIKLRKVYVYETKDVVLLRELLSLMSIDVVEDVENTLAIVSGLYDEVIECELLKKGAQRVEFFDCLPSYLSIVWTEELTGNQVYGPYGKFT